MKTFFFELLSEEIPARLQESALQNLRDLLDKELRGERLSFKSIETYGTSRRLVGVVRDLDTIQPDTDIEIRGPRVDASVQSIEGFLKSQGLLSLDSCHKLETSKGIFWACLIHEKGKPTLDLLAPLLSRIIDTFPWPKSMKWGANPISWIRPLRGILALFDAQIIPLSIGIGQWKITASNTTVGHRFLSPEPFEVSSFEDYQGKLKQRYVLVDEKVRKEILWTKSLEEARQKNLEIIYDSDLLQEVTGLVEWPCPMIGQIPDAYMSLPVEVLKTSMRVHQRYFSLKKNQEIAPYFLLIANQIPVDGGKSILAGNEKVLNARLKDALFFWEQDKKIPLEHMLENLKVRVFYNKLGSLFDKALRLENRCGRMGLLAKADLSSQMVGEFPELQGIMGGYYAAVQHENSEVVEALKGQYEIFPKSPFAKSLALADRMDTLYGFFAIDCIPTGSKDPFALRRAALSILRILRETPLEISLNLLIENAFKAYKNQGLTENFKDFAQTRLKLISFFEERLKVILKEEGIEPDIVVACLKKGWEENVPKACAMVYALEEFLKTQDGMDLLNAFRRANNILKGIVIPSMTLDESLFDRQEERYLWEIFKNTQKKMSGMKSNFEDSFLALAELKPPLDSFFDKVIVNVEDQKVRLNRCLVLSSIVDLFKTLADFSKIEKEG